MPQGVGKGIGREIIMDLKEHLFEMSFHTEIVYAFVIIVCSLMIYFATRELYELTSHKGIKYFRWGFLFFAIAYFFRSFIKFILMYFNSHQILDLGGRGLGSISLFLFMYFSSMAIFYLLYSVMWKKWNGNWIYGFHVIAVLIGFISVLSRSLFVYLGINVFLFIVIVLILFMADKGSRGKIHNLYIIYVMLFIFWIFNIIDILIPSFLKTFQLFIYLASILIFLMILYKVLKRVG